MNPLLLSRRSFVKTSAALVGSSVLPSLRNAKAAAAQAPLIAYVGTYSSPLPIIRPGQVDQPPGNGRGIHLFQVDRTTGALTPCGVHEQLTSPGCVALNASGTRLYAANETELLKE